MVPDKDLHLKFGDPPPLRGQNACNLLAVSVGVAFQTSRHRCPYFYLQFV